MASTRERADSSSSSSSSSSSALGRERLLGAELSLKKKYALLQQRNKAKEGDEPLQHGAAPATAANAPGHRALDSFGTAPAKLHAGKEGAPAKDPTKDKTSLQTKGLRLRSTARSTSTASSSSSSPPAATDGDDGSAEGDRSDPLQVAARRIKAKGGLATGTAPKTSGFKRPGGLERRLASERTLSAAPGDAGGDLAGPAAKRPRTLEPPGYDSLATVAAAAPGQAAQPTGDAALPADQASRPDATFPPQHKNPLNEYLPTAVFVGDLSDEVLSGDLETMFIRFGEIVDVHITGKNFGFVQFKTPMSAQNAVNSMNGATIRGRRIRCTRARISTPSVLTPLIPDNVWGDQQDPARPVAKEALTAKAGPGGVGPAGGIGKEFTGAPTTRAQMLDARLAPPRDAQKPTIHPIHRHPALDARNGPGAPVSEYEDLIRKRAVTSYEDL